MIIPTFLLMPNRTSNRIFLKSRWRHLGYDGYQFTILCIIKAVHKGTIQFIVAYSSSGWELIRLSATTNLRNSNFFGSNHVPKEFHRSEERRVGKECRC